MKVCVIGGGSSYTPELISGFVENYNDIPVENITLMDIDKNRLKVVGEFAKRMIDASGVNIKLEVTTNRVTAIKGADFIISQIRVGGNISRHKDILVALKHGVLAQETTGVVGFAKAIRTIPVMMDLCSDIEKYAPDAWLINFTNPSGIITEAVKNNGFKKIIGLCNNPIGMLKKMSKVMKLEESKISLDYVGLNHLAWVRKVFYEGKDVTLKAIESMYNVNVSKNISKVDFPLNLLKSLGMIPISYLKYYYLTDEMLTSMKNKEKTRAQEVMEIEQELFDLYKDETLFTKPEELDKRGGAYYSTVAVKLIRSIALDLSEIHIVNVANNGAIAGMKPESIVEIPTIVNKRGATPINIGVIESEIKGLMDIVKVYEELTIRAGTLGMYKDALLALITHPLIPDYKTAEALLEEISKNNKFKWK